MLIESQGHNYWKHPGYHFQTTAEMLEKLAYLGEDKAYEIVVTNTNLIADMIENIPPIPEGFFPPTFDDAEDK